jgi:thioesterase domain-containing protein
MPSASSQFLVPIQRGASGARPFFLVAGGWGGEIEFLVYRQLAQHLDPELPLWGFKARGAGTHDAPHESVPEMAADYLRELRHIQPRGPYYLGGECVGGICAYEMACQLLEAGEKVALLVLLDTSVPSALELSQYERDEGIKRAAEARGITPAQLVRKAGSKMKGLLRKLKGSAANASALPPQQGQPLYPVTLLRHRLRPYAGNITLLVDEESFGQSGQLGWDAAPIKSVEVLILPGDHISYIRENVTTAAETLRKLLAQAQLLPKP